MSKNNYPEAVFDLAWTAICKIFVSIRKASCIPLIVLFLLSFSDNAAASTAKNYQRIISLYPAHTENLLYLGAADKVIGISKSENLPASIQNKPKFHYREDPEKFIAAAPDLVLIRPMIERGYPQFVGKLRQAGITVLSLQPSTLDELYPYWQKLGEISGKDRQAQEMIKEFQNSLSYFDNKLQKIPKKKRPRVYFEAIHRRMKTFNASSIAIFTLEKAGGINIASDAKQVRNTNIAEYSKEQILAKANDIDIFLAQHGRMNPITRKNIIQEPGFQAIKAVQNDQVYLIEEALVSRPTPRIIEGIKQIHKILYPTDEEQ